jgi:hypothetical protein
LAFALLVFAAAGAAAQQLEGCAEPNVSVFDHKSERWVCADPPDVECDDDSQLSYSGGWHCVEQAKDAPGDDPEHPDIMCASGSPSFDEGTRQWVCREESCDVCRTSQQRCKDAAKEAYDECMESAKQRAEAVCLGTDETPGVNRLGEKVEMDKTMCEVTHVQDSTTGEMVEKYINCSGPKLDACVEGFMNYTPAKTTSSNWEAQGGLEFGGEKSPVKGSLGASGGHSWGYNWEMTQGAGKFCSTSMERALTDCPTCRRECKK